MMLSNLSTFFTQLFVAVVVIVSLDINVHICALKMISLAPVSMFESIHNTGSILHPQHHHYNQKLQCSLKTTDTNYALEDAAPKSDNSGRISTSQFEEKINELRAGRDKSKETVDAIVTANNIGKNMMSAVSTPTSRQEAWR